MVAYQLSCIIYFYECCIIYIPLYLYLIIMKELKLADQQELLMLPEIKDLPLDLLEENLEISAAANYLDKIIELTINKQFSFDQYQYHVYIACDTLQYYFKQTYPKFEETISNLQEIKGKILQSCPGLEARIEQFNQVSEILYPIIINHETIAKCLVEGNETEENKNLSSMLQLQKLDNEEADLISLSNSDVLKPAIIIDALSEENAISPVYRLSWFDGKQEKSVVISMKPKELFTNESIRAREEAFKKEGQSLFLNSYFSLPVSVAFKGLGKINFILQVNECCTNGSADRLHKFKDSAENEEIYIQRLGINFLKYLLFDKSSDNMMRCRNGEGFKNKICNASVLEEAIHFIELSDKKVKKLSFFRSDKRSLQKQEKIKQAQFYLKNTLLYEIESIIKEFNLINLLEAPSELNKKSLSGFYEELNRIENNLSKLSKFSINKNTEKLIAKVAENTIELILNLESKGLHYCDLKAGNIMLDKNYNALISDDKSFAILNKNKYHPNQHCAVIPPEQNQEINAFDQITALQYAAFQFSSLLYEMATGSRTLTSTAFAPVLRKSKNSPFFDKDIFKDAFGNVMKYLITGLCDVNPLQRMTLQEARFILHNYNNQLSNNINVEEEVEPSVALGFNP